MEQSSVRGGLIKGGLISLLLPFLLVVFVVHVVVYISPQNYDNRCNPTRVMCNSCYNLKRGIICPKSPVYRAFGRRCLTKKIVLQLFPYPINSLSDGLGRAEVGVDGEITAEFQCADFEDGDVTGQHEGQRTDGVRLTFRKENEK